MIRRLTLSLLALGCLIATADAAPTTSPTPEKTVAAATVSHMTTGRSVMHHHKFYRHKHYHGHFHRWHRHHHLMPRR